MKAASIIAVALLLTGCTSPRGPLEPRPNTLPLHNAIDELESGARTIDDPPSGIEFDVISSKRYATRVEVRFAGQESPWRGAVVWDADGLERDLAAVRKEFEDAGMIDALDKYIALLNTSKRPSYIE